ncbi:MAG: FxsA family protein [Pseudobdellovibrionaceae bacterium]|nr:FxsA family protein [Bdellovibrionales bacterium]USN47154.1 MAG: FxsA family protein [Pseudobdellovibrionaceae bacterium]
MFGFLLFMFTVVPAVELYLLIQVGQVIGAIETLGIVLLTGIVGAYMAKAQGYLILARIQRELSQGQLPAASLLHGLFLFAGGVLLVTPGFITDLAGLLMVFPLTRSLFVIFLKRYLQAAMLRGTLRFYSFRSGSTRVNDVDQPETYSHDELEVIDVTPKHKK